MIALGYVRRSEATSTTERKRGSEVVSLDVQATAIREECVKQGWQLAEPLVVEDGVSGGKRERLTRLSAALHAARAQVLVVYHSDRLARDLAGLLDTVRAWNKKGISVWVVARGWLDLKSSSGFLSAGVEGLVAEHWRLITGEKTRAALARVKSQGRRWNKIPPYGSQLGREEVVQVAGRTRVIRYLEPCPQEQAALTYLRAHAPGLSLRSLGAELLAAGFPPRSGGEWHPQVLRRLVARA